MKKTNFRLSEFIKSQNAKTLGLYNIPDWESVENLNKLVYAVLQPLRDYFNVSLYINSGFRCTALNTVLQGATNSKHMYGQAADFTTFSESLDDSIFEYISNNLDFDQVIRYYTFIHVSYVDGGNRHQIIDKRTKK
jgi:zinc D-Ala-D-Ala carboxypeptidase